MDDVNVQDVTPVQPRRGGVMLRARRDAEGLTGAVLVLGPNIVTGLAGLPEGAPPFVLAAGACLVLRSAAMTLAARRGNGKDDHEASE